MEYLNWLSFYHNTLTRVGHKLRERDKVRRRYLIWDLP